MKNKMTKYQFLHLVEKKIVKLQYIRMVFILGIFGCFILIILPISCILIYNTIKSVDIVSESTFTIDVSKELQGKITSVQI